MHKRILRLIFLYLVLVSLSLSPGLSQEANGYVRDSIKIERGIPGTLNYEPLFKVITDSSDAEGRPLQLTVFAYENENQLKPVQRQQFGYEDDETSLFRLMEFDDAKMQWILIREEFWTYEDNRLQSYLRRLRIEDTVRDYRQWLYTYDALGREQEVLLQQWKTFPLGFWVDLSRKQTTYENGRISSELLQVLKKGVWINKRKRDWVWMPGEMQPSGTVMLEWSESLNEWQNIKRKFYTMSPNGLWSGTVIQEWSVDSLKWINEERQFYVPDTAGTGRDLVVEIWENGAWEPTAKNELRINQYSTISTIKEWDGVATEYVNDLQYGSTTDQRGLANQKIGMRKWNMNLERWENRNYTRRITYSWSELETTATRRIEANQNLCQSPNPYAAGYLVRCALPGENSSYTAELLNQLGQVVSATRFSGQSTTLDNLPAPGQYFLRVRNEKETFHLQKIFIVQ